VGTVNRSLVELTDVLATVAEILGVTLADDAGEDSVSFLRSLLDPDAAPARIVSVHHSLRGVFALREGPWKYVPSRGSGGFSTPRAVTPRPGEPEGQLYHLEDDPAESRNLWQEHPEIVARMARDLEAIRTLPRTPRPR
jgi:arylsulfatase A